MFLAIVGLIIGFCILILWLKVRKTKSATRSLITSLGGIEVIFSPLVEEIKRVFVCENVSYSWNQVIVCDAPTGMNPTRADITFRLRHSLNSYIITYSSSGKSLPYHTQTWTFPAQTSFESIWDNICGNIGINTKTHPYQKKDDGLFSSKDGHRSSFPDMTNRIVKFNYLYSFKIFPQKIQDYNDGKNEYIDVMSPLGLPREFEDLFYKIIFSTTTLSSNSEIEINSLEMPSGKGIGEVHTLLFIRNKRTRFSRMYSLEYSLDDEFCICRVSTKEHGNYGIYDKHSFLDFCVSNFLKDQANSTVSIVSVTPLLEFAKLHGKMKVTNELTNPNTGEKFKSCAFIDEYGGIKLVGFSSLLGELTPTQIATMKHELVIIELSNGTLKLARPKIDGNNNTQKNNELATSSD